MPHTLESLSQQKILLLDGAMGTMIQRYSLFESDFRTKDLQNHTIPLKGNNDLLSITQPGIITDIHFQYFQAGADIVETNTFNAQKISMADYALESWVSNINIASVQCAIEARERYYKEYGISNPKFIAGAIGPTNRTVSLSPDVNNPSFRNISFDTLVEAYDEQVAALITAGVDILLVETIFDTLNAKAAFYAIENVFERLQVRIPLMASGTITDASGRTLSGQTPHAFAISLSHVDLFSIGFNCALGAEQLLPYIEELKRVCDTRISVYPNAGLPNELGGYDQSAEFMANLLKKFIDKDVVDIIGGCCGTTPEHIKALHNIGLYK